MHENPSYKCMRIAREESRAELLEMRRWDVAKRLKEVEFGEGSHENLSAIANVIYEPCFGWTKDACEYLRDQLVDLIGGQHASDTQRGCAGGTDSCDCRHEQTSLDKERQEAIDELRKITINSSYYGNYQRIALAIGTVYDGESLASECVRDRLIHLLGGDEIVRNAENHDLGDEHDAQDGENGDFCEFNHATVTSELRKYLDLNGQEFTNYKDELIATISGGTSALYAIADRIDEQFARICEQQEKVFQDTISEMLEEIDRQKDLRDENAKVAEDAIHSSCMYFDLLRDAARDYKRLHDDYVELSHDHRELYDFAKAIEQVVNDDNEIMDKCRKVLNEATEKLVEADAECRMYREMLNDAACDYKALLEKLSIAFNMWVGATGGGE